MIAWAIMTSVMMLKGRRMKYLSERRFLFLLQDFAMSISDFFKDFFSPEKECFALIVED